MQQASDNSEVSALTGDEFRHTFGSDGTLSAEERRELSMVNLARARNAKAKKKKQRRQKAAVKKITEAEKKAQEQQRILDEREIRRSLSEANRKEAGIEIPGETEGNAEQYLPEPEELRTVIPEEPQIDIQLPKEPKPEPKNEPLRKEKKKTKEKQPDEEKNQSVSRASGGRYKTGKATSGEAYRITAKSAVTLGLLSTALVGLVIFGRVQTNEAYTEIAELRSEYNDLVAKNVSMKSEMEGKMTVKNIQEYAENELHLIELNQSQIEYIQLQTEDEVLITEPKESFIVRMNDYLTRFWNWISGE